MSHLGSLLSRDKCFFYVAVLQVATGHIGSKADLSYCLQLFAHIQYSYAIDYAVANMPFSKTLTVRHKEQLSSWVVSRFLFANIVALYLHG